MHLSTFYNDDNTKISNALQIIENIPQQSHGMMAIIVSDDRMISTIISKNKSHHLAMAFI